ncbi:hypothetical protein [Streptomyces sp. NPDC001652]|uniref:hypothetical protein n=1 Tax=Streptomyces sp. NPDC001652 TaxID=3154393 RepID=UPI00333344D4
MTTSRIPTSTAQGSRGGSRCPRTPRRSSRRRRPVTSPGSGRRRSRRRRYWRRPQGRPRSSSTARPMASSRAHTCESDFWSGDTVTYQVTKSGNSVTGTTS